MKAIFTIQNMQCAPCSIMIDGALEDLEGIKSSKTNYAKSATEVEYDPQKITKEKIIKIIKKTGYTAKSSS